MVLIGIGVIIIGLLGLTIANYTKIIRLYDIINLFNEKNITANFLALDKLTSTNKITKSSSPLKIPETHGYKIPKTFECANTTFNTHDYLKYTTTNGFLVIHNNSIVYELYNNGLTPAGTHVSWSVAKSFVSTLLGFAYYDGLIDDLNEPVTKYLPDFKGTGYNGVAIKDILQMSSGVLFNEDYTNFYSDINRFGRSFAFGSSYTKFSKSLKRYKEPGTYCNYVSMDTQVLGILISRVTGKSLSEYLAEKVWEPLGMEHDAQWMIDNEGTELALGGMNVSLRDFAKLGQFYLHKGNWNGKQLLPEQWIKQSVTPDAPHLMPGENEKSSHPYGYGYHWWIPEEQQGGDYFAAGIYNQYIYVNPQKQLVIVKLSANHHFKEKGDNSKAEHIAMFQAIAAGFGSSPFENIQ